MAPIRSEQHQEILLGLLQICRAGAAAGLKRWECLPAAAPHPHPPPDSTASSRPHRHNGGLRVLLAGPSRLHPEVRIIILGLYGGQEIPVSPQFYKSERRPCRSRG